MLPLHETLTEQLHARGLSLAKLGELTNISDRYLTALFSGQYDKLPALPYVRGYLRAIAPLLDLDIEELWTRYQHDGAVKRSGASDALPVNRFALRRVNRRVIIGTLIILAIMIYLIANAGRLIGKPELTIIEPASETIVTALDTISIVGHLDPRNTLTIGDQEVFVAANGQFSEPYPLEPGVNRIEITARKLLGRETTEVRTAIYQPVENVEN